MTVIRVVRALFAVGFLGFGIFLGTKRINQLPPLGHFLDPYHGIWSVARAADLPADDEAFLATLDEGVNVVYDRRGVPHIEATSLDDAVRALGYTTARDRMFQLELQARAAAGKLTELLGERALEADQHQRSIGLPWSAERDLAELDPESETARFSHLYAEGVNAWIDGMEAHDVPFEYQLLGTLPERWEPINSIITFKRMGYTLSYSTHDRWRQGVASLVGREATAALFPINSPIQEPIQPSGLDSPRFDFMRLPPPPEPERRYTDEVVAAVPRATAEAGWSLGVKPAAPPAGLWDGAVGIPAAASGRLGWEAGEVGSNNWAVAPQRTATGDALLSGDPHLGLTLPSIWYEVHIVVPGEIDVYGVTIPGIPGVVIGFNRDVAWSFTNTGADVLDYYWETLDHASGPERYMIDGEWRELERRVEQYRGRNGELLAADTLYMTHRGPVFFTDDGPLSMRWTVLEETAAIGALFGAARAQTVEQFGIAMESFHAPAQNMIVADRTGDISIRSTGLFPIRPGRGDGTVIRDGTSSANDWVGYWSVEDYPGSTNPAQGYLASANQQPVDPEQNDRYLGVDWPASWRAMRINRLLRNDSAVTVDAMSKFHTEPGNEKAELFVPAFLEAAERVLATEPDEDLEEAVRLLAEWDRRYTKDNERAVLFETALSLVTSRTWDELAQAGSGNGAATPGQSVLASLLRFGDDPWWDHRSTGDVVETRDDILTTSLVDALEQVIDEYGSPEDGGWRWDKIRHANIWHLLGFPALSATNLPIQGGSGTLNPSSGSGAHGASWRMVVEMGERVKAWVMYPGGQSGNPASRLYDDRITKWVDGELDAVLFPDDPDELSGPDVLGVLTLEPEGY